LIGQHRGRSSRAAYDSRAMAAKTPSPYPRARTNGLARPAGRQARAGEQPRGFGAERAAFGSDVHQATGDTQGERRDQEMVALTTGGAGFIGSHLADRLIAAGEQLIVMDDLSTGSITNI